jgi:hypothetical protein
MHINMMNTFPEKAARMQVLLDQAKPLPRNTSIDIHDHDYGKRPFIWIRGYAYSLGAERRAEREAKVARRERWEREKEAAAREVRSFPHPGSEQEEKERKTNACMEF